MTHPGTGITVASSMILAVTAIGLGSCSPSQQAGPLRAERLDGTSAEDLLGHPRTVRCWIFVSTDCPIANGLAPAIAGLCDEFRDRVSLNIVHVNPDLDRRAALAHATEYGYRADDLLIDREHCLVRRSGVQVTPEAVVFDGSGTLRYRGPINDRWRELGVRRPQVQHHFLREALDAVLAGRPVPRPSTQPTAIGCPISDWRPH